MNTVVNKVKNKIKYCKNIVIVDVFFSRKDIQCIIYIAIEGKMLFMLVDNQIDRERK